MIGLAGDAWKKEVTVRACYSNISLKNIAEQAGLTPTYVYMILREKRKGEKARRKIIKALDVLEKHTVFTEMRDI